MARRKEALGGMERAAITSERLEKTLFGGEEEMKTSTVEVKEQLTLTNSGETAIVRLTSAGMVEVDRNDSVTQFQSHHTVDSVLSQFVKQGWEVTEDSKVVHSAMKQDIPVDVQTEVDEYLVLHEQMAELKARAEEKKKSIRGFMEDEELTSIKGTHGKQVYLQDATATNSTSRYTDFELKDVQMTLPGSLLTKVTEIRVNADKLKGVLQSEKLPKAKVDEILATKVSVQGTPHFKVKK